MNILELPKPLLDCCALYWISFGTPHQIQLGSEETQREKQNQEKSAKSGIFQAFNVIK